MQDNAAAFDSNLASIAYSEPLYSRYSGCLGQHNQSSSQMLMNDVQRCHFKRFFVVYLLALFSSKTALKQDKGSQVILGKPEDWNLSVRW